MVLIDENKGVLNRAQEFNSHQLFRVQEVIKPAKMADILRVHDYRYIKQVIGKCKELQLVGDEINLAKYDRDSMLSSHSWQAALLSTGSIIEACDMVMSGEYRNAFCAVRPPGHHAGVFGKTFKNNECDQEQTNGFCYINNVAVAASYLKSTYRSKIKKVAIVDFDVHHGNGTQEIVECMQGEVVFREKADACILYDNDPR